jgi:hypothetical protein
VLSWAGHYNLKVENFDQVHAATTGGTSNSVMLNEMTGNATFIGRPYWAELYGAGYDITMAGWAGAYANGLAAMDSAYLYDSSAGHAQFSGQLGSVTMSGQGYSYNVLWFGQVYAYANGPSGTATLVDGSGGATFNGHGTQAQLSGPGYLIEADGFASVIAQANPGTTDRADIDWFDLAYSLTLEGPWIHSGIL